MERLYWGWEISELGRKTGYGGQGCFSRFFADVDVFDIEVNEEDIDKFVEICAKSPQHSAE